MYRQPPFLKNGSGYQDTLIWLAVLELLAAGEPIVLVSKDEGFGQKTLNEQLAEEAAGMEHNAPVMLAKTLTQAFEMYVQPQLDRLGRFEDALKNGHAKLNLGEWLAANLLAIVRDHASREAANRDEKPDVEYTDVEKPKFAIQAAHALTDRDARVRIKVETTGHFAGWQWFPFGGPGDFEREWVEHDTDLTVELELMISDEATVSGHTVLSISPPLWDEPREPDFELDADDE